MPSAQWGTLPDDRSRGGLLGRASFAELNPTAAHTSPTFRGKLVRSLLPYVSVVSGCDIRTTSHPHHSDMTGILTGMKYQQLGRVRDTIASTFAGQSAD